MPFNSQWVTPVNLSNSVLWNTSHVRTALAAYQLHLNYQGIIFNPFILQHSDKKNDPQVLQFAQDFNQWYPQIKETVLLSIAVNNDVHWTAVHILCEPSKAPLILCLDAADDGRGDQLAEELAQHVPDAKIYYLEQPPVKLPFGQTVLCKIQTSNHDCSRMCVWHLALFAKSPQLLTLLTSIQTSASIQEDWQDPSGLRIAPDNLKKFTPEQLPAAFAKIYKPANDIQTIILLPKFLRDQVVKNQQSLCEYAEQRKVTVPQGYVVQGVIKRKQELMQQRAQKIQKLDATQFNVEWYFSLTAEQRTLHHKNQVQLQLSSAGLVWKSQQLTKHQAATPWYQVAKKIHLQRARIKIIKQYWNLPPSPISSEQSKLSL